MNRDRQTAQMRKFIWDLAAKQRWLEARHARLEQREILLAEQLEEALRLREMWWERLHQAEDEFLEPVFKVRQEWIGKIEELKNEHGYLKNLSRPKMLAEKAALQDEIKQLRHDRDKKRLEVQRMDAALRSLEVSINIALAENPQQQESPEDTA